MTTQDLFIGALIWLMGRNKGGGGGGSTSATKAEKAADALKEVSGLQARANQAQAAAWSGELEGAGASPGLVRALIRWIGIESSGYGAGDPKGVSKLGERGLLQIMPTTAKEALSPGDWQALTDPATTRAQQAQIALKQFKWHLTKAAKYVKPWPGDHTFDGVWYAKLHHQRPADLSRDQKLWTGAAATDAAALTKKYASDPAMLKRIAAANVVTWGTVTPP